VDDYPFGSFLFTMLVCFVWFAVVWMFVAIFIDIIRRRMSGWAKAGWIVLLVLLPFIGSLIYIVARPKHVEFPTMSAGPSSMHYLNHHSAGSDIARGAQEYSEGIKRTALG
jgi:hypothetical protein